MPPRVLSALTPSVFFLTLYRLLFPFLLAVDRSLVQNQREIFTGMLTLTALDSYRSILTPSAYVFYRLILRYGLRPAELLRSVGADYVGDDTLVVRGVKHSASRLVHDPFLHTIIPQLPSGAARLIFPFSYRQVYRTALYIGLAERPRDGFKHARVLSAARARLITAIKTSSHDERVTADAIGHRSIKSQLHYLKEKKEHGKV